MRGLNLLAIVPLVGLSSLYGSDWISASAAELSEKASKVEPNADAEVLVWEVRVRNETTSLADVQIPSLGTLAPVTGVSLPATPMLTTQTDQYIRLKIFNDRGRDRFATLRIPNPWHVVISDISARWTQPDGTIVVLDKHSIFEEKAAYRRGPKAFALPGVVAGSIIEYRWRETRDYNPAYREFSCQRDVPVRLMRYFFKPSTDRVRLIGPPEHFHSPPLVKERHGFMSATVQNIPGRTRS